MSGGVFETGSDGTYRYIHCAGHEFLRIVAPVEMGITGNAFSPAENPCGELFPGGIWFDWPDSLNGIEHNEWPDDTGV